MKDMGYADTFIIVAADCPAERGVVPVGKGDHKPIHVLQYELLAGRPYHYTHADLLFEVHVRHKAIPAGEIKSRGREIRAELLSRPHPCLRASPLPKKFGWGVHYDGRGRIALHAMDSPDYTRFAAGEGVAQVVSAMRTSRA